MRFVLASHNAKKLQELCAIVNDLGIDMVPLPPDAPQPEEDGATFVANALIKARAACAVTGMPALADDSGLCVDALNGAPGIYSARYGSAVQMAATGVQGTKPLEEHATDRDRTLRLLSNLRDVPDGKRQARFVCAIACAWPDGRTLTVQGECAGEITREMQGDGGFGYDPVFHVSAYGCTLSQLPAQTKNQISHRAHALAQLREALTAQL